MMQQRFEDEEALRREHMTDEEARAVVELWAEKERERQRLASMPSVGDMAEGLQVPVEVAHSLLAEVRDRNAQTTARILAATEVTPTCKRPMWIALILAAVIALAIALGAGVFLVKPQVVSTAVTTEAPAPVGEPATTMPAPVTPSAPADTPSRPAEAAPPAGSR